MKKSRRRQPIRTCIVCGAKRPKHELARLVLDRTGGVREDPRQTAGGRGAYICRRPECRKGLGMHRKLNRVFRSEGPLRLARELGDEV